MNSNVTPFFLIILSLGLFYAYINPNYAEITKLRAQETEYMSALEKAQQIQQLRSDLLVKYNSFSPSDLNKLETLLPDNVNNVRLVLDLANEGKKYNIIIKNIKVDKPLDVQQSDTNARVKSYGQAKVTFSFTSSYDNFTKFIQDIEQSLRIVDVSGMSFRAAPGGLYDYTIDLNTYWLK
jgi:Tfp pilus assembly protein PilO